ncbi:MAG: hypothetical protein AAGE59_32780 [Cyanobacteria bacterium P01_F01_bin.86]
MSIVGRFVLTSLATALCILTNGGNQAFAEVLITPDTINISGRHGSRESRFLLLQTDEAITQLELISLDLERMDGQKVLSADAIQLPDAPPPPTEIQADGAVKVPLTLDLSKATSNGQFQGVLLVKYEGGQQLVPLTVNVQARPWLPALILLLGVFVGMGLSDYRRQGLDRDELTLAVGKLKRQVRADQTLPADEAIPEVFTRRIQAYLYDVEASLVNQDWVKAKTQLGRAQGVWNAWKRQPENWLAQFKYYQTLKEEAGKLGSTYYIKTVLTNLEDCHNQIPSFSSPSELKDRLDDIRQQIDRFHEGYARTTALKNLGDKFRDSTARSDWDKTVAALTAELYRLNPSSEKAFKDWEASTQTAVDEAVPQEEAVQARTIQSSDVKKGAPSPAAPSPPLSKPVRLARWRLRLFNWGSRGVVVLFLSWAGFSELYLNQPTFGMQPLSDYFSLLVWGFGAEVTRESVAKRLKNLGVLEDEEPDEEDEPDEEPEETVADNTPEEEEDKT